LPSPSFPFSLPSLSSRLLLDLPSSLSSSFLVAFSFSFLSSSQISSVSPFASHCALHREFSPVSSTFYVRFFVFQLFSLFFNPSFILFYLSCTASGSIATPRKTARGEKQASLKPLGPPTSTRRNPTCTYIIVLYYGMVTVLIEPGPELY